MHGVYYIAATLGGKRRLYTYDLRRAVWHCDGEKDIFAMTAVGGSVWYLTGDGKLYELGAEDSVGEWSATLAPFIEDARLHRHPRVILKLWLAEGAAVRVSADNGSGKNSIYIRRADEDALRASASGYSGSFLRVKLEGRGKCLLKGVIREYME